MNLYKVISEELSFKVPILDDGTGPEEPYRIAQLVLARSHRGAEWAAWKTDKGSWTGDPRDKPVFRTKLLVKDVEGIEDSPPRVVSEDPRFRDWWAEGGPGALDTARLDWLEDAGTYVGIGSPDMKWWVLGPANLASPGETLREAIDRAMGEEAYRERLREGQESSGHCTKAAP